MLCYYCLYGNNDIVAVVVIRYEIEYEEAKRKTKEVLHPLKIELAEIDDQVRVCNELVMFSNEIIFCSFCLLFA